MNRWTFDGDYIGGLDRTIEWMAKQIARRPRNKGMIEAREILRRIRGSAEPLSTLAAAVDESTRELENKLDSIASCVDDLTRNSRR